MGPWTIVKDEPGIPLALKLEVEPVVLEAGVAEAPHQSPHVFELMEESSDAKDLHREEQADEDPP